jgi:hypothetical protein
LLREASAFIEQFVDALVDIVDALADRTEFELGAAVAAFLCRRRRCLGHLRSLVRFLGDTRAAGFCFALHARFTAHAR